MEGNPEELLDNRIVNLSTHPRPFREYQCKLSAEPTNSCFPGYPSKDDGHEQAHCVEPPGLVESRSDGEVPAGERRVRRQIARESADFETVRTRPQIRIKRLTSGSRINPVRVHSNESIPESLFQRRGQIRRCEDDP